MNFSVSKGNKSLLKPVPSSLTVKINSSGSSLNSTVILEPFLEYSTAFVTIFCRAAATSSLSSFILLQSLFITSKFKPFNLHIPDIISIQYKITSLLTTSFFPSIVYENFFNLSIYFSSLSIPFEISANLSEDKPGFSSFNNSKLPLISVIGVLMSWVSCSTNSFCLICISHCSPRDFFRFSASTSIETSTPSISLYLEYSLS